MDSLRRLFLLDPEVVFLNHGSFGATPRPVFEVYQEWQRKLEREPVQFIIHELAQYFEEARRCAAQYLHVHHDDLVFVPNATFGVNVVARSLNLGRGDEVLASDHEYGACDNTWEYICGKTGATYVRQSIPLPVTDAEEMVECFWAGVTPKTKVIFLSHITSSTALRLPVEAICRRAREAGILTLVDGAHAPGQIALDLEAIGADFYTGNFHKWAMAPKGAAFLYTRRERQHLIEPLVVSWGWKENILFTFGSQYLDYLQWWGTKDPAAYLTVPAAIQFLRDHDWDTVRQQCHELVSQAITRICELTGLAPVYPNDGGFYHQMAVAPLPQMDDLRVFGRQLYEQFRVQVPCMEWNGRSFIRVSVQGYNSPEDVDALLEALKKLLP